MAATLTAPQVLDRYFLEMRAKVLEVGASLDRLDAAGGIQDNRLNLLQQAINTLQDGKGDRAARTQMIFTDQYEPKSGRPKPRGPM